MENYILKYITLGHNYCGRCGKEFKDKKEH